MNSKRIAANAAADRPVCGGAVFSWRSALLRPAPPRRKRKRKTRTITQPTPPPSVVASAPDETKIDYVIGEFLGAWQLGDIEKMHKNVADDVSVVAGTWTPPAVGWTNYLVAYQAQRARMQQVRLDRQQHTDSHCTVRPICLGVLSMGFQCRGRWKSDGGRRSNNASVSRRRTRPGSSCTTTPHSFRLLNRLPPRVPRRSRRNPLPQSPEVEKSRSARPLRNSSSRDTRISRQSAGAARLT